MVRKARTETKEQVRGGAGSAFFEHILEGDELMGHASLFAKVTLRPHSSVGWHQHVGNTEPYFIIKGEGLFIDDDGSKTVVRPGDVCVIEVGQSHSIENNTDEDMEMIALVINDWAK